MSIESIATKYKNTIGVVGIFLGVITLAFSARMVYIAAETLNTSRKATEANISFDYYMRGYKTVLDIYGDPIFIEFLKEKSSRRMSKDDVLKAGAMMVYVLGVFEVGFILNKSEYISNDNWKRTRENLCGFVNRHGVKRNPDYPRL